MHDKKFFETLVSISNISNNRKLGFEQKLDSILHEIVTCMQATRGSIMVLKGRKSLEVVASTNHKLIGIKQPMDNESASSWVMKNKAPLYVDKTTGTNILRTNIDRYGKNAFLIVPIISHNKAIGVLNVTEKMGGDSFDKKEQKMLLNIAGLVISAIDNQRLAESLRKSKRTIQNKNLQLRKLERLKTDLFNMLIHDLKGPISELVANLDILSYTISDDNRQYVESAQIGCDTLIRMVGNLLDVARLEEGKLQLMYEKIDPQDLIKESLARLFGMSRLKGLRFVERFPSSDTNGFFWGDRSLLLRVLQNLLANAIHYSPFDETIEVGFRHLESPKIEFFVKDNGPGIPSEYHEAIFDKFKQAEKKGDGRIYTTGLGLTFCKMAIEEHKGEIAVKSGDQKGSIFEFVLPIETKYIKRSKK